MLRDLPVQEQSAARASVVAVGVVEQLLSRSPPLHYANMRSVDVAGSDYGRFTKALGAGHLTEALLYAADIRVVALGDALRVCELMARDGDHRFSRAASRWVERFGAETGAGLPEVQLAAAALGWLWESPDSKVPISTLNALLAR